MPSKEELQMLQALPLEIKIMKTQQRIREWVQYYGENGVAVSFSGGKDSTVLLHLVRQLYPNVEAMFVDTGLEYPEIRQFVKTFDNVTILRPKMRFDEVIKTYGYPFISKEVGNCIYWGKRGSKSRLDRLNGTWKDKNGEKSIYNKEKYKPLLDVDFLISDRCCGIMKKAPAHKFKKAQIVATMAEESLMRFSAWIKTGCNAFDNKKSSPMSFWTEQDVLRYIKQNNLKIASVYGDIISIDDNGGEYYNTLCSVGKLKCSGCQRTGCIFCGFGAHLEKGESRFQRLKRSHPKQYNYCMGGGAYDTDGLWKPTKEGLGMKHCIDELNKIYGKDFIKY